jgi:hypothetical protein
MSGPTHDRQLSSNSTQVVSILTSVGNARSTCTREGPRLLTRIVTKPASFPQSSSMPLACVLTHSIRIGQSAGHNTTVTETSATRSPAASRMTHRRWRRRRFLGGIRPLEVCKGPELVWLVGTRKRVDWRFAGCGMPKRTNRVVLVLR